MSAEAVIGAAGAALYDAKRRERNRTVAAAPPGVERDARAA